VAYNLQVFQVSNLRRQKLEIIVSQVKGAEGFDHEKVSWQTALVQVVVGQVENFERRKGAKAAGEGVEAIDALKV